MKHTHGGKRKGAGRKSAPLPVFIKKFRATKHEIEYFKGFMSGNARKDFLIVLEALITKYKTLKESIDDVK